MKITITVDKLRKEEGYLVHDANSKKTILVQPNTSYNELFELLETYKKDAIPAPPDFPLNVIRKEGKTRTCEICGSSISRKEMLGLFGELTCDNTKCANYRRNSL